MNEVWCDLTRQLVEGADGQMVPGLVLKCIQCDHAVEVMSQGLPSCKRALAMMREECPKGQSNWYLAPMAGAGKTTPPPEGTAELVDGKERKLHFAKRRRLGSRGGRSHGRIFRKRG